MKTIVFISEECHGTIGAFLRSRKNVDFSVWFQEKIDEAIHYIEEELIFEHDEEDDE